MTNTKLFLKFWLGFVIILVVLGPLIFYFIQVQNTQYNCVKIQLENLNFQLDSTFLQLKYYQTGSIYKYDKRMNPSIQGYFTYSYQMVSESNEEYLIIVRAKIIEEEWHIISLKVYTTKHVAFPYYFSTPEAKKLIFRNESIYKLSCK